MIFWLITWESDGNHAEKPTKIAAILNGQKSPDKVRELIEFIYANEELSLTERLHYAKNKKTRYRAQFNGNYMGQIVCGHNPYLYARLVEDVKVRIASDGNEFIEWRERPIPENVVIYRNQVHQQF